MILTTFTNTLFQQYKNKKAWLMATLGVILVGCGGFVYTTVGGTVTGLGTGNTLRLINEGNFFVNLTADGPFSFREASNAQYRITVGLQPNTVNCTIANGSGAVGGSAPVTSVRVTCVPNVPLGGTINGLVSGTSITLTNNNGTTNSSIFTAAGAFTLGNYAVSGANYAVVVAAQPFAQNCTVVNGTGTADNTNLPAANNIVVNCVAAVPVGLTLSGLVTGRTVTLTNNGGDTITLAANGTANFPTALLNGASYNVQISTQPSGQTCNISAGTGTAVLSNPATPINVLVNCI